MTVSEVIDALGGTNEVAALFGVGRTAVVNWRTANHFPARLHYRISQECRRRKIRLAPDMLNDWGAVELAESGMGGP